VKLLHFVGYNDDVHDDGSELKLVEPDDAGADGEERASDSQSDEEEPRYRIVLGDTCPICRVVSQITFTADRPPQIPVAGCREAGGCRCALPVFGEVEIPETGCEANASAAAPGPEALDSFGLADLDAEQSTAQEFPAAGQEPPNEASTSHVHNSLAAAAQASLMRDEATGCYTWPAFIEFGEAIARQAVRRGNPLSLLLLTLDDSPAMAAESSPSVERALVGGLAAVIQRTVRSGDVVGRYGPRSVAVLASDASPAGALELVRRTRIAWSEHLVWMNEHSRFGVSVGLASMPEAGATFESLLSQGERALGEAVAHGADSIWLSDAGGVLKLVTIDGDGAAAHGVRTLGRPNITERRREALAEAAAAYERGETKGIAVRAQPNCCSVCRELAQGIYTPETAPQLPHSGCLTPGGCRCLYALPIVESRRAPVPLRQDVYEHLDIPANLYAAALFGIHPHAHCEPEPLAEYLDAYPLMPVVADIDLQPDEVLLLRRTGQHGWEVSQAVEHGPSMPLAGSLRMALATLPQPLTLPRDRVPYRAEGTIYITNWRVMFLAEGQSHHLPLADIADIEWLEDGIACSVVRRQQRQCFFLQDALQVGLILARAVRDVRQEPLGPLSEPATLSTADTAGSGVFEDEADPAKVPLPTATPAAEHEQATFSRPTAEGASRQPRGREELRSRVSALRSIVKEAQEMLNQERA
jgi:diguanylate cyclase (GGDEF)-like protein